MNKEAGILMPLASLPSNIGVGNFGKKSYEFINYLFKCGFKIWQILPLNPLGYGHSPYQPFSSLAIDEIYIDLSDLYKRGYLEEEYSYLEKEKRIDYEGIRNFLLPILKDAYQKAKIKEKDDINTFSISHPWAIQYAIFKVLKEKNEGRVWNRWPSIDIEAVINPASFKTYYDDDYSFWIWVEMTLYREWKELKEFANKKGIRIMGDVPFYVGFDSIDVLTNQDCFMLDKNSKEPSLVAGVPPDYFSKEGQRWGNPVYNWDYLKEHNFSFLIERLKGNAELYDVLRLDHFRAFDTFYEIPAKEKNAIKGEWKLSPGYDFFNTFLKELPNVEIVAEDLGELRNEVYVLRDHFSFPGMNVIEFTFIDSEINHTFGGRKENQVSYIGTHDNLPFKAFFNSLNETTKDIYIKRLKELGIVYKNINEGIIKYVLSLPSKYSILSMCDLLSLGEEARINEPGTLNALNWTWRLRDYCQFKVKLPIFRKCISESNR